ncbi:hypothetical protein FACS1894155_11270 [Bacteroidia bacterium]|nr:hypothetical protein FACS189455_1870 [Bacteroidia bacterium]GHU91521.1 hypothetical protein FACS1894155_11270 [Bacteroidia bacterium]
MKRYLLFLLFVLFFFSCNNDKKAAQENLQRVQLLYENNQLEAAKQSLDSLKAGFPKEVEVLKEGLQIMRQVEIKELERNILYYDSMLIVRTSQADSLKKLFVYEKDPKYDETGKYIDKQQVLERNLGRSYIRSGVNEQGEMYIASVYHGKGRIRHNQLKVSAPDNSYTETAVIPEDGGVNFSFQDLGMTTEVVTYQNEKDNGVILFIYNNSKKRLKAELPGNKSYSFFIAEGDIKSLIKTHDFSVVLSDIQRLGKEKEKANARIEYLSSKLKTEN